MEIHAEYVRDHRMNQKSEAFRASTKVMTRKWEDYKRETDHGIITYHRD